MADATMERLEKQLEGNNLALSAVAEILQKMDFRYSKDEEVAIAKQEEDDDKEERTTLIKEIASEVVSMLKGDNALDVDGTKVRSAAKTKAGGADDSERPVNTTTKISDQQATIQAMVKGAAEDDAEEYPVEEKKGGMKYKAVHDSDDEDEDDMEKQDDDDEDEDDFRKQGNGKDEEDDDEPEEMKAMAKQLNLLKKQVRLQKSTMKKAIEAESESRLRKMGFREENGLQRPKQFDPLGIDGTTRLQKQAQAVDVVDQLATLSYKELREMQSNIEMGNTEGIPRELLGN